MPVFSCSELVSASVLLFRHFEPPTLMNSNGLIGADMRVEIRPVFHAVGSVICRSFNL